MFELYMDKILKDMEHGVYWEKYDKDIPYEVVYETAQLRENMVNWFPFKRGTKIMYINTGYGAIIPFLCRTFDAVYVIEENQKKINYICQRCEEYSNLTVVETDIFSINDEVKVDYVFLDEYFLQFVNSAKMQLPEVTLLQRLSEFLNPKGEIILVTDNRLSLAGFAGAYSSREDELFQSIDRNGRDRVFSKRELIDIMKQSGIRQYQFFYPFPMYAWPKSIYTDEAISMMPYGHHYNIVGKDRYVLFNEFYVNDELQKNQCADIFANSFFIRMSKYQLEDIHLIYVKNPYFMDRRHKIYTSIFDDGKEKWVAKRALTEEAQQYLNRYYQDSLHLSAYVQEGLHYVEVRQDGDGNIIVPYMEGSSVSRVLRQKLEAVLTDNSEKGDTIRELYNEFGDVFKIMKKSAKKIPENVLYNADFTHYFGNVRMKGELLCIMPVALDLHVDHLYRRGDTIEVIDTDPIGFFWIPVEYLMYSLIDSWCYTYVHGYPKAEERICVDDICGFLGIEDSRIETYQKWRENVFSNNQAVVQIEPFYGNVFKPKFTNLQDIHLYGIQRDARGRFQKTRENKQSTDEYSVNKSSRFILYGAAALGKVFKDILQAAGYQVIGFMDKRNDEIQEAHGLPVWSMDAAPQEEDIIVLISVKNVFEHQTIANELYRIGYTRILFLPEKAVRGEASEQAQKIYDIYNMIIAHKGKDAKNFDIREDIPFMEGPEPIVIKDTGIVRQDEKWVVVQMPLANLFTAQKKENENYPWAEQSIFSLIPHLRLYDYLWGGKDKIQYYIDFCSYGANGSDVEMTDGWKKNLIGNRLLVLNEMKKSMELDPDFFVRNAPKAVWNSAKRYFNLNEGRHRAALFVYENRYTMPVRILKEEYKEFYNWTGIAQLQNYFNENIKDSVLPNPVSHPAFNRFNCMRPQYYTNVVKCIMEILSEYLLCRDGKIDFSSMKAGICVEDCGELKRLFAKIGCKVYAMETLSPLEMKMDNLFEFCPGGGYLEHLQECHVIVMDVDDKRAADGIDRIRENDINTQFIFLLGENVGDALCKLQGIKFAYKRMRGLYYQNRYVEFGVLYKKENHQYLQ